MRKPIDIKRIAKHILFWLSVLLYYTLYDYFQVRDTFWSSFIPTALFLPHNILLSYLVIYWLIPNLFIIKKYFRFFILLLSILLLNLIISYTINYLFIDQVHLEIFHKESVKFLFVSNISFVFVLSLAVALKSVNINNLQMLRKEQADSRFHQAEVALLRSQINPHFLYNTLNNINTLVFIDQQKTYDSIIKLSEIMRYMHEGRTDNFVPLERELNYLSNYVDLQKMRFRDEQSVQLHISVENHDALLAPMIFMSFVENAFKHCNRKDLMPAILIQIQSRDSSIELCVQNHYTREDKKPSSSSGFGLKNTRQRLDLLYHNNHDLNIEDSGNYYKVNLKLGPIERK